ncbi:MAG: methyltransferase domain-containing protein [Nannocystaceae bacterium]
MTSRAREVFFEVFEALPRQGPGSLACTRRALALCRELPPSPRVLDLGCGAGAQTLHLASLLDGSILALDSHPPLVDRLRAKLSDRGLRGRVEARVDDMTTLRLPSESFDLVWSEGALYNLGLEAALPMCAGLLRPGGYLAFTDAVWRTTDPPPEVREAFADYPTMGHVADVLSLIEANGYSRVGHFDLPHEAWWDDFYSPMEQRIEALRAKYTEDAETLAELDECAKEPQMHRRSGHHYGYTFFVARRP